MHSSNIKKCLPQKGFALIELMIAMLVLVLVAQSFTVFMNNISTKNIRYRDRAYAMQKAIQMMEELRSQVLGESQSVSVLDSYSDNEYKFTLTTQYGTSVTLDTTDYLEATRPMSDNWINTKGYKFIRRITIIPMDNDPAVRRVWVRVYYARNNPGDSGVPIKFDINAANEAIAQDVPRDFVDVSIGNEPKPLAEIFAVLQTVGETAPPTQLMDIFLVVLENVPGWWVRPADLRPMVQSSIINLQTRNAGLYIRERWIKRMSFGRDEEYTPEMNVAPVLSNNTNAFQKTYIYPGWVPYDDTTANYFDPAWFSGRFNARVDNGSGVESELWANSNYAMADQWNHAVSYPEELEIYDLLSSASGEATPEISLRMLLEGMNSGDTNYKNSIVLNLHAELVPILPLRPYPDAAKDPVEFYQETDPDDNRAYRVVAHPEKLLFDAATNDELAVRVYAYNARPEIYSGFTASEIDAETVGVTLFFPDLNRCHIKQISRLDGNSTTPYEWVNLVPDFYDLNADFDPLVHPERPILGDGKATFDVTDEEHFTPVDRPTGLRIQLYNVPVTARECVDCL